MRLALTPPTAVKRPPTYTPEPLTAIAETWPFGALLGPNLLSQFSSPGTMGVWSAECGVRSDLSALAKRGGSLLLDTICQPVGSRLPLKPEAVFSVPAGFNTRA